MDRGPGTTCPLVGVVAGAASEQPHPGRVSPLDRPRDPGQEMEGRPVIVLEEDLGDQVILRPVPMLSDELIGHPLLVRHVDVEDAERNAQPFGEGRREVGGDGDAVRAPLGHDEIEPHGPPRHGGSTARPLIEGWGPGPPAGVL